MKKISNEYKIFLDILDDDYVFCWFFNFIPFSLLEKYVPIGYLQRRFNYLKKNGKLKKLGEK